MAVRMVLAASAVVGLFLSPVIVPAVFAADDHSEPVGSAPSATTASNPAELVAGCAMFCQEQPECSMFCDDSAELPECTFFCNQPAGVPVCTIFCGTSEEVN